MNPLDESSLPNDQDLVARRKRQIWLTVIVMLLSFCLGTTGLLVILWFLIKYLIPQIGF